MDKKGRVKNIKPGTIFRDADGWQDFGESQQSIVGKALMFWEYKRDWYQCRDIEFTCCLHKSWIDFIKDEEQLFHFE